MKINIGCGYNKLEEFINCDNDPLCNPDIVFDLETDRFPFDDNIVEEVLASHVLEHLGDGYFHCLQELYRICKPGALIYIAVPHPRHDSFLSDPTHKRPITISGLKLFSKKHNDFLLENNYGDSLLAYRLGIDFEIQRFLKVVDDTLKPYFETFSSQDIDLLCHINVNIVREIKVVWKVIK